MNTPHHLIVASLLLLGSCNAVLFGQVECAAPGNLRGIRIDGELMAFSTSIRAVVPAAAAAGQGGRGGGGGGQFSRDGGSLIVTVSLSGGTGRGFGPGGGRGRGGAPAAGVSYRATYKDMAPGTVDAEILITSTTNVSLEGIFFAITLPGADYAGGSAQLIGPTSAAETPMSLAAPRSSGTNLYLRASAKGVRVNSPRRQIELSFPAPAALAIQDVRVRGNSGIEVSFPLSLGNLTNGQIVRAAFTIKATGDGGRGGRASINPEKWDKVGKSIGSYLEYLKQNFGSEPVLFSFNESDMGINVLQSPQEHADAIKRLGSYFASRGLKTRMLLGDTGNPTGDKFIDVALADPEAAKHIGAVSFHSWNGGTAEQYTHFSQAARQLNVPLLVGEGGLDPSAHQYRAIFLEPWFCLNEIAQYVEICRVAQPLSILHWQFTADYSILTGGTGDRPLQPAPRFWQIKQLGMTAADSTAVPITCDNPKVVSCAFADHGACVVHLVNNGAARTATVFGLPSGVKEMRVFVTDRRRGMQETGRVPVVQGTVQLSLDGMSFTSLAGNP